MDKQAVGLMRRAHVATLRAMELRSFGRIQEAREFEAKAQDAVRSMERDFGIPREAAEAVLTYTETGCEWEEIESDVEALVAEGGAA